MRAELRWTKLLLAGGLLLGPAAALAQSAPPSSNSQPTSNTIGPSELQNFSLPGSVTHPADQPPAPAASTTAPSRAAADAAPVARTQPRRVPQAPAAAETPRHVVADTARATSTAERSPVQTPVTPAPAANVVPTPAPVPPFPSTPSAAEPTVPVAPDHQLALWPWLLAAAALAGATLFLLWRRRSRHAFAGGPEFDLFVPPEPAPTPRPDPAPAPRAAAPEPRPVPTAVPAPAPPPKGIVSTRLRPHVEIAVHPLRCAIDDQQVVLDFEIELFNAGAVPARAVTAEASLFNAGATQEQDLAAFFAKPGGLGDRLDVLGPMQRVTFTSQVVAPRGAVQEYELAGRKALVPVIAFNALYEWNGRPAQTSAAYLVGRETKGDKLGPLPVNGTAREFRGLGARALPTGLRT